MIDQNKTLKFTISKSLGIGGVMYGPYTDRETPIHIIRKVLINGGLDAGQADAKVLEMAKQQKKEISLAPKEEAELEAIEIMKEEYVFVEAHEGGEQESKTAIEILELALKESGLSVSEFNALPEETRLGLAEKEILKLQSSEEDPGDEEEDEKPEEEEKGEELPADFPGRDELIQIGYDTIDKVREVAKSKAALVDLPGIGDVRAQRILDWFKG